jgi:hypothetical protein
MALTEIILTRHGKKVKSKDIPNIECPLSEEGLKESFEMGQSVLERDYDLITVIHSPYVRTRQTAEQILAGAGYDLNAEGIGIIERSGIGMIEGVDYTKGLPPFGDSELLDEFVRAILTKCYFKHEDKTKPVMAGHASAMLDSIDMGIGMQKDSLTKDQKGLLLIVSHAAILDSGLAVALDALKTHIEGKEGYVTLGDFPGAHQQGEFSTGKAEYMKDGTVRYAFDVKGRTVTLTDEELKDRALEALRHSRYIHQKQAE